MNAKKKSTLKKKKGKRGEGEGGKSRNTPFKKSRKARGPELYIHIFMSLKINE